MLPDTAEPTPAEAHSAPARLLDWCRRRNSLLLGGLAVLAVFLAFFARLAAHSRYLRDPESLMVPTVGREWLHGHLGEFIHFQYNAHQGGIVVDGLLSALGFAVFGDHYLAWKWYSLAYGTGIAACGLLLLRRTCGRAGGLAFCALMAGAPFLLKDGLITPPGHHASATFYALLALAVAVGGRLPGVGASLPKASFRRALLAGCCLGLGVWYTRSTAVAGPALLIAVLPGGWRAVLGLVLGCLVFPLLAFLDSFLLYRNVTAYNQWGLWGTFKVSTMEAHSSWADPEFLPKIREALALPFRPWLFAQPYSPSVGEAPIRAPYLLAGRLWVIAWLSGPVLAALGLLVLRRAKSAALPFRRILWGSTLVCTLLAGYFVSYVISPFRIDTGWVELVDPDSIIAPGLSGPRYLLPTFIAWTLLLAQAIGTTWLVRWTRPLALAVLVLAAGTGLFAAQLDWTRDRDPAGTMGSLQPYDYRGMWGLHRGPPESSHTGCSTEDPISRANHLRSLGWFRINILWEVRDDPKLLPRRLRDVREEFGLSEGEADFFLHGFGAACANELMANDGLEPRELVTVVRTAAETLPPAQAEHFLHGFVRNFPLDQVGDLAEPIDFLCAPMSYGSRTLCQLHGRARASTDTTTIRHKAEELFDQRANLPVSGELAHALGHGAGVEVAFWSPWTHRPPEILAGWPDELAAGFQAGWAEEIGRQTWAPGDPYIPSLVP
ncbi:MAG: hypothetical protein VX498_06095 [Myxococcota bacterium]|nr:hypothetical protein [Myxococcota bacterium]